VKIRVPDIPPEGIEIEERKAGWFLKAVHEAFGKEGHPGEGLYLSCHVSKTCETVRVSGEVRTDLDLPCHRCLERFPYRETVPLEIVLSPLQGEDESPSSEEESMTEGDLTEDMSFSFYRGNSIDLSEIVREAMVLSIPIRLLCRETCKGICPQCGQNRNLQSCPH